jgi:hypothetical protein
MVTVETQLPGTFHVMTESDKGRRDDGQTRNIIAAQDPALFLHGIRLYCTVNARNQSRCLLRVWVLRLRTCDYCTTNLGLTIAIVLVFGESQRSAHSTIALEFFSLCEGVSAGLGPEGGHANFSGSWLVQLNHHGCIIPFSRSRFWISRDRNDGDQWVWVTR